jgi:shikimate dehydrogenase
MEPASPPLFTGHFAVNGATRLYGTIGNPIRQLRATAVMSQVFAAVGANAVWLPFEGGADILPLMLDALARMRNLGGFTVTIPHKTAILPLLTRATRRAQASGSVNLVKRDKDGALSGDIVDGVGFVRGLEAHGHKVRGASVCRSTIRTCRPPPLTRRRKVSITRSTQHRSASRQATPCLSIPCSSTTTSSWPRSS